MTYHIIIDTETTGLEAHKHEIIQVGAVFGELIQPHTLKHPKFTVLRRFNQYVFPDNLDWADPDMKQAMQINKITQKQLSDAPPATSVALDLELFIDGARYHPDGPLPVHLHAYNNEFDSKFLNRWPWGIPKWTWSDCIMLKATRIMGAAGKLPLRKGAYKYASLAKACDYFGVNLTPQHDALKDAELAAKVWEKALAIEPTSY